MINGLSSSARLIMPIRSIGRAIAPPNFRPKSQQDLNDFVARSVKADSNGFARARKYLNKDPRNFEATSRQKLIALIKKRNKKSGKTYWAKTEVLR